MEYGGCDISRCFHWLMTRAGLPYKNCDVADRMDALLLQELKETYCHLDQVRRLTTNLAMCGNEMWYDAVETLDYGDLFSMVVLPLRSPLLSPK